MQHLSQLKDNTFKINLMLPLKVSRDMFAEFPSGLHALQANFYLAQLYFSKNQKSQSVPHYEYVVDRGKNEYTEQSLARLSQLYLDDQNTNKAIPLLKRLENESNVSQNITYAQSNLMKIYYEMKDYSETISYAEKVLSAKGVDNRIKSDAHIMIARSSMQTGDEIGLRQPTQKLGKLLQVDWLQRPCIMMLTLNIKKISMMLQIRQYRI